MQIPSGNGLRVVYSFGVVFLGEEVDLREDAIYALILGEECGWINGLKTVMDRVF